MSDFSGFSIKGLDMSAATSAIQAYQSKLLEIGKLNLQLSFDYAQALTAVKSPSEFANVSSEYTKKQLELVNQCAKDLASLAQKQSEVGVTAPS